MPNTAVELLKAYGTNPLPHMPTLPELMVAWIKDKEFSPEAVAKLAVNSVFGKLIYHHMIGAVDTNLSLETTSLLNNIGRNIHSHVRRGKGNSCPEGYEGTRADNLSVDHALSETPRRGTAFKYGQGSSNRFTPFGNSENIPSSLKSVTVAIIGSGAASILVARALKLLGFANLTVFEKSKALGIWANENVYGLSRNNPLTLNFGDTTLEAAPGSGDSVKEFLNNLLLSSLVSTSTVKAVHPGSNFDHVIEFTNDIMTRKFQIVINCSGLGTPRPVSDKSRMTTTATTTEAGERWQRKLDIKACRGKRFVFIGLGNSTAEMLRQIHSFQDLGADIDYRVMTHYPEDAVHHPEDVIQTRSTKYRVFRDISIPNLTSWQGDLSDSRYDYFRALRSGKIVSGVKSWNRKGRIIGYTTNKGGYEKRLLDKVDNLFTLIGYAPTPDYLISQGMRVHHQDGCAELDYDGEVQTEISSEGYRVYRGYFAMGAMTANPQNKNAIVIPGMLFRLNDLLMSVILRAAEASILSS